MTYKITITYAENAKFWFLNASWIELISPCCLRPDTVLGCGHPKIARLKFI